MWQKTENVLKEQTTQFFFKFCIILFAPGKNKLTFLILRVLILKRCWQKIDSPMQQNILSFLHLKTKSQCSILDQKGVFEHQNRYPNSASIKQDILTQILMVTHVTAKCRIKNCFCGILKGFQLLHWLTKCFHPILLNKLVSTKLLNTYWRTRHTLTLIYDVYAFAHTTRLKS